MPDTRTTIWVDAETLSVIDRCARDYGLSRCKLTRTALSKLFSDVAIKSGETRFSILPVWKATKEDLDFMWSGRNGGVDESDQGW